MHFHGDLRNRREQLVWRREKRFPFCAFDVHLDDHTSTGVAIPSDLVFQRVEETRFPVSGLIADTFVVKVERTAVAGWMRGIKTVVLMHRSFVPARHLASPVIVRANAVRVC